ncbi:extracellular solute-binding protein [Ruania alkalisoli]|uniref:Extracellular solute-binding protein n=1 Tax=Ruania alkalisoli TaxID=2779775 RepID=A0A7M1SY54_9MICO|nr:extracellular solute-binding protein [Ruania alkalisoli]QOR72441.1 extracellular solute-binding protein [Ruania alkalisoli]
MNRRRATCTVAITASLSLTLVACGGGGTDGGALGSGESLTVITSQAPWNPAYDAVVAAYEDATGVDVDLRSFPNDDVKSQMLNDAQTGNHTFDVYQVNEVDLAYFNGNELLMPLTDIDSGFALDEAMHTYDNLPYWDAETETFAEGGALTSIPLLGNLQILVYRTDVYDELGLDAPQDWPDTLSNAETIVDAETTRYGHTMRTQGIPGAPGVTYDFSGILFGMGGSFFTDPGTDWTPALDTPEALEAATMLRDLAALGPADPQSVGQAEAIALMQSGEAAQLNVVGAAASGILNENNSNVIDTVGFAPLPGGASPTGTWNLTIPADLPEERQQAALDFITWVTSEEGQEVFVTNGGIPTRSDVLDAEGLDESALAYLDAVSASAETARGTLRLPFIGEFLSVTEPALANIAAGEVTPEEGLAALQEELTAIVTEGGYVTE